VTATLVITNGDSAAEQMREAGFTEKILPWRDVLHDGPVPDLPPRRLAKLRAGFLSRYGTEGAEAIEADFAARDALVRDIARFDHVSLWFEHDLYDQLQLIQILGRLAGADLERIALVQADTYLFDFSPVGIGGLRAIARPVTDADTGYASAVWRAFTGGEPTDLNAYFTEPAPLRFAPAALCRLAEEFPHQRTGLSRTQSQILSVLADGPERANRMFGKVLALEEAKFMGDLSFADVLDDLAFGPAPLISGLPGPLAGAPARYETYFTAMVSITGAGREVAAGRDNHIRLNGIDRWIGGAHLTAANFWQWDGARLIAA